MFDESLVVFTPARAAQLTGLSRRQVDYWRKTLLLAPSTDEPISPYRSVRLYDFTDMLALMTIAELLRRKLSLQRVRRIVADMRREGHDKPLTQVRYGTVKMAKGKREKLLVTMTLEDGTVVGDDDPGQGVLAEVIDIEEIRARIRRGAQRSQDDVGRVERRRNTLGSRQVFAGTRVPVDTVRMYLVEGIAEQEILEAFPALERADIDAVRVAQ